MIYLSKDPQEIYLSCPTKIFKQIPRQYKVTSLRSSTMRAPKRPSWSTPLCLEWEMTLRGKMLCVLVRNNHRFWKVHHIYFYFQLPYVGLLILFVDLQFQDNNNLMHYWYHKRNMRKFFEQTVLDWDMDPLHPNTWYTLYKDPLFIKVFIALHSTSH